MNYFLAGKILTTHGLKGEIKIKSLSDFNRFEPGKILYILQKGEYKPFEIVTSRMHKDNYLVSFKGLQDINLVEYLKNVDVYVDEDSRLDLEEDEYYYDELIGKEVYLEDNTLVGVVTSVLEFPQGHYLEVKKEEKKSLIPFRKEFIKEVYDDVIEIFYLEGLI